MMTKHEKRTLFLTTLVCLVPIVIGAILYPQLPETIATHWDGKGVANGYQSKFVGVFVFPGILLLVNLLMPVLLKLDPKHKNMNGKLKTLVQWIIPLVEVFASGTTLAEAMGKELPIVTLGCMFLGVMFVAIGNYLPKTKQSYMMGIKLPWTLNSEENWNRTHRLGGFVWVIGGIIIMIAGLLGLNAAVPVVVAFIMVFLPTVYSFVLYKKGI